jgi:tetratricopeptide (TPR) repeat protein
MRVLPVIIALLAPSTALAAKYAGPPKGTLEADAIVDVPLYRGLGYDDPTYVVEATVGEETLLLRVDTGWSGVVISEKAAQRIGAKIKGKEDDNVRLAVLPDVQLGGAVLKGVKAVIGAPTPGPKGQLGSGRDGVIGLGLVGEGGFAILPSQGVLRIAPAGMGGELVAALGATPTPYVEYGYDKVNLFKGESRYEIQPITHVVPVSWSGVTIPTAITTGSWNFLAREVTDQSDWYSVRGYEKPATVTLPPAPSRKYGDATIETRDVTIGGRTATVGLVRTGIGPHGVVVPVLAQVGIDALYNMDVAADGAAKTIALKPAEAVKLADYAPIKEAALRKKLEVTPVEGEDPPTEEDKTEARKNGLGPLASFLSWQGRTDEALQARTELVQLDGDKCNNWLDLGTLQLEAGQPEAAVASFLKADELYQPWSVRPLAERQELQEDYDEAKEKKEAWDGPVPQANACHVAPGRLARAYLAVGEAEKALALYPSRLDLDIGLPERAGNAHLLLGDTEAAEAAYRQSLAMVPTAQGSARAGLFFALQRRDFELALSQVEKSFFSDNDSSGVDPELVRRYAEAVRQKQGAAASVKRLQGFVDQVPTSTTLRIQLAREQIAAGAAADAETNLAYAEKRLNEYLAAAPRDPWAHAKLADLLLLRQKTDEARTHAVLATQVNPAYGYGWLVLSRVEAAAGDTAKTAEYRKRATVAGGESPAYALLSLE